MSEQRVVGASTTRHELIVTNHLLEDGIIFYLRFPVAQKIENRFAHFAIRVKQEHITFNSIRSRCETKQKEQRVIEIFIISFDSQQRWPCGIGVVRAHRVLLDIRGWLNFTIRYSIEAF